MKTLNEQIENIKEKYESLKDEINIIKADGSLSKLCNLRSEFDETFDFFFDNKDLRKKYNAWDKKDNCLDANISNRDLEEILDESDKKSFIEFINSQIDILEDEKIYLSK